MCSPRFSPGDSAKVHSKTHPERSAAESALFYFGCGGEGPEEADLQAMMAAKGGALGAVSLPGGSFL